MLREGAGDPRRTKAIDRIGLEKLTLKWGIQRGKSSIVNNLNRKMSGGRGGFEYVDKLNKMSIMLKFGFEPIP